MSADESTRPGTNPGAGFSCAATLFHIVLVAPEIPNNTGTLGRTCVALGCALHLVEPLGFGLSDKAVRRAGLDYWARLDVRVHQSWDAYLAATPDARRWLFSARAARPAHEADLRRGDHLVFGSESAGLAPAILDADPTRALCLPILPGERSVNLACAAAAAAHEGVRQAICRGELGVDSAGRLSNSAN